MKIPKTGGSPQNFINLGEDEIQKLKNDLQTKISKTNKA